MDDDFCEQDKIENPKKKMTTKKDLRNTIEVSSNLNTIYEKTYELKKDYYEKRLEFMKRNTEAMEKIATSLENRMF